MWLWTWAPLFAAEGPRALTVRAAPALRHADTVACFKASEWKWLCVKSKLGEPCARSHTHSRAGRRDCSVGIGLAIWLSLEVLMLKVPEKSPSRAEPGCDTRTHPTTTSKACKVDVCCYLANYGGGRAFQGQGPHLAQGTQAQFHF